MFALADKVAKARYPKLGNGARMKKFFNDEVKNIMLLGTGLDIEHMPPEMIREALAGSANYDQNNKIFTIEGRSIGDIMYKIRCSIMHEAEEPSEVEFRREHGVLQFSVTPKTKTSPEHITFSRQFCEHMHMALLGCPEFTSVTKSFEGRRCIVNGYTFTPSQCVGKTRELYGQLMTRKAQ